MNCKKCKASLYEGSNFCTKCGQEMTKHSSAGNRLCHSCGYHEKVQSASGRALLLVAGILHITYGTFGIYSVLELIPTAWLWDMLVPLGNMSWSTNYALALALYGFKLLVGAVGIAYPKNIERAGALSWLPLEDFSCLMLLNCLGGL